MNEQRYGSNKKHQKYRGITIWSDQADAFKHFYKASNLQ